MSAQIPSYPLDAIRPLLELPHEKRLLLARAFAQTPIEASVKKFIDRVVTAAEQDPTVVRRLVSLFISLQMARMGEGSSAESFTADLIEIVRSSNAANRHDDAYWEQLATQIRTILSSEGLHLIAKSLELQRDNEKLFSKARILTDIRPVFGDDVRQAPRTGVVLHTLKLSYYVGEGEADFYVVLDKVDLKLLREVIDRAIAKDATLTEMMDNGKLTVLQAEEEGAP